MRGIRFQVQAGGAQFAGLAVTHGDDEVRPEEQPDGAGVDHLAGLGQLSVRQVPGGADDEERDVLVPLDLGPLRVRVERVLDGQRVQAEDLLHRTEVTGIRFVEPDPDERVGQFAGAFAELVERPGARLPDPPT
ncbi:hypothetical protein GCM10010399_47110 [Dactylosporangium fulvum]